MRILFCVLAVLAGLFWRPADASAQQTIIRGAVDDGTAAEQVVPPVVPPVPRGYQWRITKPVWTASDERAYGEFIRAIGMSGCRTVDACLKSAANIYRGSDPAGSYFYADCADLPYVLRAYFAWKNGLPFSYASGVAAVGRSRDLRYSRYGNYVFARTDIITPAEGQAPNARTAITTMYNILSSAVYRFAPDTRSQEPFDFYPVKLAPGAIRPGTNIYDPNGHVAVVYDVDHEGRIRFIDSHPDNSLTRGTYGKRFVRASAPMGAGFKNWRPQALVGATQGRDGSYIGGRIVLTQDAHLPDWSDEQFYGNGIPGNRSWREALFVHKGETLDYYDYVRRAVAGHDIVYDPVTETRNLVRGICDDLHYRVQAVDIAIKEGINNRPQPGSLPNNIYGTDGDWETYSSPSRDARLKVAFIELKEQVQKFLAMSAKGDAALSYKGSNLAADLAMAYRQEAGACMVTYQATDGSTRSMNFEETKRRLYLLSFDPYHCIERRWGATSPQELASCPDGETKRAWYEAEQRLRNQPDRTYDVQMGFSLAQLRAAVPGSGIDLPPDVGLETVLGDIDAPAPATSIPAPGPGRRAETEKQGQGTLATTTMDRLKRRGAEIAADMRHKLSEFVPDSKTQ